MMKLGRKIALVALLILTCLSATSCLEERIIDIVLQSVPLKDYHIQDDNENYATPGTITLGQEIRDALEDAGYGLDALQDAHLVKVEYGVIEFTQDTDWVCTGSIDVSASVAGVRQVGTIVEYENVLIPEILDQRVPADLVQAGVDIVDDALNDFIESDGALEPTLTFTVIGGNVTPDPTPENPIDFWFRTWITIQVIVEGEVEIFELF